jgi:hypothetical protein
MEKVEYKDASWAQLRDGSWGLRIQGEAVEGEVVRTQTRGGKTTYESVGKVVTQETRGIYTYAIVTVGPKPKVKKPKAASKPRAPKLPTPEEYNAEVRAEKAADDYVDFVKAADDLPY